MNFVGKAFVLITFSLSLFFLTLSLGVFTNHVKWGKDKAAAQGAAPSIVEGLQKKITEQGYARDRAQARYNAGYQAMSQNEITRAQRQYFYTVKYDMLNTGKNHQGQPVQNPIRELEYNKQGEVLTAEVNLVGPKIIDDKRGTPLLPGEEANAQLASLHKLVLAEQASVDQLQINLAKLTVEMQGDPADMVGRPGLIALKELQVEARRRAIEEQEALKPTLSNRYGEAVVLLKREQGLRKRLEQLEKTGTSLGLDK